MSMRQLEYFKVVASTLHITKAAELLCITQPSLSHAINELEKSLGVKLFEKKGRNISLTKYGTFYLAYVNRSLDELDRGKKALKELVSPETGHIDLAFIYTLGPVFIPKMLSNFKSHESYKNITFSLHQGNSNTLISGLKNGQYDLAICSKIDQDDTLEYIPIVKQELVLITPLNHPLAKLKKIDLRQVKDFDQVYFNTDSGLRPIISDMLEESGVVPKIKIEVEEDHAMAGFVANDFGIGILPKFDTLSNYSIKVIPIYKPVYSRYIYLVTVKDRYLSPTSRVFKDFLIAYSKANYLKPNRTV